MPRSKAKTGNQLEEAEQLLRIHSRQLALRKKTLLLQEIVQPPELVSMHSIVWGRAESVQ
jgi:hypothetical protein